MKLLILITITLAIAIASYNSKPNRYQPAANPVPYGSPSNTGQYGAIFNTAPYSAPLNYPLSIDQSPFLIPWWHYSSSSSGQRRRSRCRNSKESDRSRRKCSRCFPLTKVVNESANITSINVRYNTLINPCKQAILSCPKSEDYAIVAFYAQNTLNSASLFFYRRGFEFSFEILKDLLKNDFIFNYYCVPCSVKKNFRWRSESLEDTVISIQSVGCVKQATNETSSVDGDDEQLPEDYYS
ncbi:hypothetical protein DICVIV_12928 [Dictyocaulus viviparus]|uniref:Uncharacterized protein n=1 Tax=Dictyocaulus viviparus TaxID=29172 RepID=A0A0D8X964_DICVI|nr:hypothetical protein DICVIV_12928 [Dictyocaulus viviparus]